MLLWDKAQSDYKDHDLKAGTWNNMRKSEELLGLSQIIQHFFLLPSADSFKKGCCQLQAKVCARITG